METIKKKKKKGRGKIKEKRKSKAEEVDHLYKGQRGLCKENKKKANQQNQPPRQRLIYIILIIIIIIIIKVYENKRTPGNLGIKKEHPKTLNCSVM